jgi:hypothetical protein
MRGSFIYDKTGTLTFNSVLRTMIFSVEMKRSTSVLGWVSPSGACVRHADGKPQNQDKKRKKQTTKENRLILQRPERHRSSKERERERVNISLLSM